MANTFKEAMSNAQDILAGHVKELTGTNAEISKSRLEICKECPIFVMSTTWGPMCDKSKWINEQDEVSDIYKSGYVRGCGCRLEAKTRNMHNHCIIKKW